MKKTAKEIHMFFKFLLGVINFKFIVVPFGKSNLLLPIGNAHIGYTDYYVFGIRVARLQQTKPWG